MTVTVMDRNRPATALVTPGRFLVRVGGLPLAAAEALTFPRTADWAGRTLDLADGLRQQGQQLADLLAEAVAEHIDVPEIRARLINLRRDVFNGRAPRDADAALALLSSAAPAITDTYRRWVASRERHATELAAGRALFDAELPQRRAALRALAVTPQLRHGMLLSSRVLDRQLGGYLGAGDRLGKRDRRMERSLVEYVYRAATKTSPFSTFTTICDGEFTGTGTTPLALDRRAPDGHHHIRLNVAALVRLASAVLSRTDLRAELPVRLVTGLRPGTERMSYLRRSQVATRGGGGPVELDLIHENLFHLPSSTILRDLTQLLVGGRTLPLHEVSAALVARDPDDRGPDDVDSYLDHLLRLGVLVAPALRVDIHAPDPLTPFRIAVRALDRPWSIALAERLDAVAERLDRYAGADLAGRRELLDEVGAQLGAALEELDSTLVPPETLLYEDVALPGSVRADRGQWDGLLVDLAAVAGILPVFDISIARRLVTKGYFRARYGAGGQCDDLLTFAHEYQDDFFDHFVSSQLRRRPFDADNRYVRQSNTFQLNEIDQLDDARDRAAQLMNAAYAELPADAEELVLDDDFFTELRGRVPETLGPVEAHAFFLQVAATADRPLGVVNKGFTGPALMLSRFAHCLTGTGGELLAHSLASAQPDGVVFAELKGGYEASNLNLHPAATDYELVCPGDVSSRPVEQQIPIDDLVLYDDPVQDRLVLRSRRLDVEVVPIYLGFLLPMALPEVQQVLLTFSPTGMAALDLWAGTTVPLPEEGIAGYPRIRYRDVVLQRRMWKAHPACLPTPAADAPGSQVLLDWARWRREHGLPRRVFVTPDGGGRLATAGPGGGGGAGFGSHKPLYVDFDSYFSLLLLASVARNANRRLVFTEMLPDHDQQPLTDDGRAHVSELVLAFNASREGSGSHRAAPGSTHQRPGVPTS
ncbi:lantibiotic dehydratase [Micromonospora sonneratiae]|uniref:Lantibiotic dehydratase n=1 Tax=Micromonospora sonneratiae TaxID=1184706 RepID=A0ABW3Y5S2_9ACTN